MLEIDRVSLSFGGLRALSELAVHLSKGEVLSIIGPNGAGKTTVFNVITGVYTPTDGDVRLGGKSLVGLPPHKVTRLGVARTFQSLRLFLNMSVIENVMAAAYGHTHATPLEQVLRLPRARREEREVRALAEEVLSFFGQRLAGCADRVIALDHGVKIAEGGFDAVASHPSVVEADLGRDPEALAEA